VQGDVPRPLGAAKGDQYAVDSLRAELRKLAGPDAYIVIDRTQNRLYLRNPDSVLVAAICATGSGKILSGDKSSETWHFQTPRRIFTIQKKVLDPIWKKPTWAFVEKNESAPVLPWEFNRLDGTTLGAFGLELQDSYAIHGTLYPNLLGRNITHGCVRLNDLDLATTFRLSEIGTRVYVH
jgi:L,D-transpeptidase YbiS